MREPYRTGAPAPSQLDWLLAAEAVDRATEEILRGVGPEILAYLRGALPSETDAADAFAVFAVDVWRGLPGLRGGGSVRGWAYRIARRAAARVLRDPWRRRRASIEPVLLAEAEDLRAEGDGRPSPWCEGLLRELRCVLPPGDDELLEWRICRGLSWRAIAAVRAAQGQPCDEATLRKRFQRIKARLARLAREAERRPRPTGRPSPAPP